MSPGKYIVLFIISIICLETFSQTVTVRDKNNLSPVENVSLYNKSLNISTLTGSDGKANINNFMENDSIFFQHPSFHQIVYSKKELLLNKDVYLIPKIIPIEEYVITASRSIENRRDISYKIDVIDSTDLSHNYGQTSADILVNSGNIFVQKTQGGGGSPVLRGFEANKILLVVDGVRMNNAIYRSGHLQNAITIDHEILEKAEILYGPASLVYGSDALGGVIHYMTKEPELSGVGKSGLLVKGRASLQYSSANSGNTGHLDLNVGSRKIGSLTSISMKDFGDIRMGKNKKSVHGEFGEQKHFVKNIHLQDSTFLNPDPFIQRNTGYSQIDFLQKIRFAPSSHVDITANLQYSTSSDIDRLDYLNDYNGLDLKYAEYYYGPQKRLLASLKTLIRNDHPLYSSMSSIIAYQKVDEDRYSRRFRNDELFIQEEDVHVLSYTHDFRKQLKKNRIIDYGFELYYNHVASSGFYENITDHSITGAESRYPDGGTHAWSAGIYGNYSWYKSSEIDLSTGLRYQFSCYSSEFRSGILPYEKIEIKNGAMTGSMNFIYTPSKNWQLNTILSTGFRNPNLDDYGKVRAKDGLVTVPNPDIKPEYTCNLEIGLEKRLEKLIKIKGRVYFSLLTDAMVRSDFTLNGSDSLEYDNEVYKIITTSNANRAYITGLSVNLESDFISCFGFKSTLNLTRGHDISDDVPLAHIPPLFGLSSLNYKKKSFDFEFYSIYNGWKRIEDFSPLGEDNQSEALADGSPSWFTLNILTGYSFHNKFRFQIALENILDTFYKPFSSGVCANGRNLIITLKGNIN